MATKDNEELNKSIDTLIDSLFVGEESEDGVEKSIDIAKDASETADEAVSKAPKSKKDEARGAGRPKQISDVPQTDLDGRRGSDYDSSTTEKGKEKDQDEIDQVGTSTQINSKGGGDAGKPRQAPYKKSLSEDEYAEYEELKKAQTERVSEELRKVAKDEQEELIKSVIERTATRYESKIESLEKSLNEQGQLMKAMANQPIQAKSITNIEALEKGSDNYSSEPESFTRSEMLDAAEELQKSGEITVTEVIELENNGFIYNPASRKKLEQRLNKN